MQYLRITWKRSLRLLPAQLFITVVLLASMSCLVFGAQKFLYGEQLYRQQKVAIVVEDDSRYTPMLIKFVQQMDSVRTACKFQIEDREDAFLQLQEGEVLAVMVVPQNVLEDIMNGTNTPVQVYMPLDATFESTVFGELLASGASLLTTAQAQTYAVYDLAISADTLAAQQSETPQAMEHLHQYEQDIDEWNLDRALKRGKLFSTETVNVTGKVDLPLFYGISAGILITMLWGMGASFLQLPAPEQTGRMLHRAGLSTGRQITTLWLVEGCWLFLLQIGYLLLLGKMLRLYMDIQLTWSSGLLLALFLTALLVSSLQLLVYTFVKEQGLAIITLAILSMGMLFLSGGLVPAAFLPKGINAAATYLPTTWVLQIQSTAMQGNGIGTLWAEQYGQIVACLLGTLCFLVGAGAVQKWKTR